MISDKKTEQNRYDDRASVALMKEELPDIILGSSTMPQYLRPPYQCYEKKVNKFVLSGDKVLEIGAGSGLHTLCIVQTGANVIASDISPHSLEILQRRIKDKGSDIDISIKVADMESLPFEHESLDVISSAGSLSYGDNRVVMDEIYRVLKKDGIFICVDSLNHNPIYRTNRWIHHLRGNRTLSTLKRMPTTSLIKEYEKKFGSVKVSYFGSISWLSPFLKKVLGETKAADISDWFDNKLSIKKSAFKFVMVVRKVQ